MGETPGLLDDYLRIARYHVRLALPPTAIRIRSLDARQLLARSGLRESGSYEDLLAAARAGDSRWLKQRRREVKPAVLAGLAQTLAQQDMLSEDRVDSLAIYDLIRVALGANALPSAHQGLHAQLAFAWQGPERARELLRAYRQLSESVRTDLELDLANPFAGSGPVIPWLTAFRKMLPDPPLALEHKEGVPPFDRLTVAAAVPPVEEPERISVIVTSFHPDEGLITAVRSILDQSWRNVEVIIVDDASPPEYDAVLARAVALGSRIRLVKQPVNMGTYEARNAGLDAAEGEFAAFQDSDDWSHPRRLELQVRPLLDNRRLVATTSDGLGVSDDLLITRPGVRRGRFNPSSLLFRRALVMGRIGYFDRVRKAADSEYIGRMRAVYGERAVEHVESEPLALIRLSLGSLSRSEIRPYWMHPARTAYMSAYQHWHSRIAARTAKPHRPRDGSRRPFAAPDHLLRARGEDAGRPEYDVVVVADWRFLQGAQQSGLEEIRALVARGLRVAIMQTESLRPPARRRWPLCAPLQQLVNDGRVDQILPGDENRAELVIVRHAAVLQFPDGDPCLLRARQVMIVADEAPTRSEDLDRRYSPEDCSRAATRLFGPEPVWCPQDPQVRALLRAENVELTPYDLPAVINSERWSSNREGASAGLAVVGTDLSDEGVWPRDVREAVVVYESLGRWDVRLRLPDWPRTGYQLGGPRSHLVFDAADLDLRTFVHQLDFYLHFPSPERIETFSRPALEAAAHGCVVVMPERHAAVYGDAAVYCGPGEVEATLERYQSDRELFAEQSRRARAVVAKAHHPQLFVDRIAGIVTAPHPATPVQRSVQRAAGATR
ncbi:glycosyltransferase family A protein [Actinoplanes friuliensis]|uniref:Putative glycosyltransferase n=1 Tax=Actinoplanes friuliensis DSM 7358 TaxID=1246995 RepID=U5W965_9ACTN|nr:glycosyltransferase family A protein [Actinoplanes friuliensis]AGZ45537.1 putative glycosyltransferase [Actinoplanes friuliensis DSM 7358]